MGYGLAEFSHFYICPVDLPSAPFIMYDVAAFALIHCNLNTVRPGQAY